MSTFASNITLHGYTPVRRREATINTRRFHEENEKEWTSARCHRLLRALTSRVAILKKELGRICAEHEGNARTRQIGYKDTKATKRPWGKTLDDDVEWGNDRKKIRRTYSNRLSGIPNKKNIPGTPQLSKTVRRPFLPGEIAVPTPILVRAKGQNQFTDLDSEPVRAIFQGEQYAKTQYISSTHNEYSQIFGTLQQLRQKNGAIRYGIYEGLYNGTEALLRSTSDHEPRFRKKGARSLFSTCLKTIPRYIKDEEDAVQRHIEDTGTKSAINTREVQTEVYDYLEAFGSPGRGWKQFQVIVRGHGFQILSDAIREGLLGADICGVLVTLCIHSSAMEEAEILLASLLSCQMPGPRTLHDSAPRILMMLWKYVECTGRTSFQYQHLANMLLNGTLPLGWLATNDFRGLWIGIMQRLSPESINEDALSFLDKILPLLAGTGSPENSPEATPVAATKHTFSSILTTLSSIVILSRQSGKTQAKNDSKVTPAYEHINYLLKSCLVQHDFSGPVRTETIILATASILIESHSDISPDLNRCRFTILMDRLYQNKNNTEQPTTTYTDLVSFICSVARCCGRGASDTGFSHLGLLHQNLERTSGAISVVLQSVLVDSALEFAQQSPEPRHLEYAATLDLKYSERNPQPLRHEPTEVSNDISPGYRWEEGIGEWVAATPGRINYNLSSVERTLSIEDVASSPLQLFSPTRRAKSYIDRSMNIRLSSLHWSTRPPGDDSQPGFTFLHGGEFSKLDIPISFSSELCANRYSSSKVSLSGRTSISSQGLQQASRNLQLTEAANDQNNQYSGDDTLPLDMSFPSISSAKNAKGLHPIDRTPGLGRRVLMSSQRWQQFDQDESEDELSFLSESLQSDSALRDITNNVCSKSTNKRKSYANSKHKSISWNFSLLDESEDELCK
ncbi:hypothetical protein BGZ60DRAFT_126060 [Tricladium varicosporioides]|nr:hypothetical protein BGZ60DRAFT_126060 [Hymenoscyphus varicosporioides]